MEFEYSPRNEELEKLYKKALESRGKRPWYGLTFQTQADQVNLYAGCGLANNNINGYGVLCTEKIPKRGRRLTSPDGRKMSRERWINTRSGCSLLHPCSTALQCPESSNVAITLNKLLNNKKEEGL